MTLVAATRWLSVLARLGLAAVWLTSGWLKAVDPLQTVVAVRAYQLLPEAAVTPFATVLPFAEIGLGLLLLAGVGVRVTALLFRADARSLSRRCRLGLGARTVHRLWVFRRRWRREGWRNRLPARVGRDVGFLLLAVWLVLRPESPGALGAGSRLERRVAS